ncbi:MAG: L,D-transpeptidase family protein [Sedimenticola sp.]|nr:L,D-transpeptidase family protein [Sedimenticola sp.]
MLLPLTLMMSSPRVAAGQRTVQDVLLDYQPGVVSRLQPRFQFSDIDWPPRRISLVVFKDTRLMEMWALGERGWRHVKDYRVKGMSGSRGPKLKEGDLQVPEGSYRIEKLNPNSNYHLSLKLNYPNPFDRMQAERDGRDNLGGDIFIHGDRVSSGCLAMGDRAAEELFVLAAMIEPENISVLISPRDFRFRPQLPVPEDEPEWVADLNQRIATRLLQFPLADKH